MLLYWIWYAQLKKLSCAQKRMLLQYFRDPEEIYHSDLMAFAPVEGITKAMLEALEDKDLTQARQILEECANKGIGVLPFSDDSYPARLRNTYDPPMVLYCRGTLPDWESLPVIGIVGTRKATPYGLRAAYRYGGEIAACGALVISGGAAGVDARSMEGALAAGGNTVGVLGCGVDVVYPPKNKYLFAEVVSHGCLISEYPPKEPALAWHFPQRNRIISGIANGLLVVEAPAKSGALITARLAQEQGRDVFAVPGNVDEPACAGSNALLQDQAAAALSGWDVVKEYRAAYPNTLAKRDFTEAAQRFARVAQSPEIPRPRPLKTEFADKKSIDKEEKSTYSVVNNPTAPLQDRQQAVLAQITREPVTVDEVIDGCSLPAGVVKAILTKLTVQGWVIQHPGGRVSRK